MRFVWGGEIGTKNAELLFIIEPSENADTLEIYAADTYTVTIGGKVVSYGPERCAAGYARLRRISISDEKRIEVRVRSFGITNYCVDKQDPYFAFRLLSGGAEVMSSDDISSAYIEKRRIVNMPRYSGQRGFTEGYDLSLQDLIEVPIYEVSSPVMLDGNDDACDYPIYTPSFISEETFSGFDEIKPHRCPASNTDKPAIDIELAISKAEMAGYKQKNYAFEIEKCGLLSFEINARTTGELIAFFEEILPDGKWIFRRAGNNDFVYIKFPKGKSTVTLSEPFAMKLLRLVLSCDADVSISLVGIENDRTGGVSVSGDERVVRVFEAARNTFMQNATDIFMDCPGRERAGWLCDSYFTAIAERFFTGKNTIERAFLENYILADTPELAPGMLPMCFPAEHVNGRYIPNWAMWFVVELWDRVRRCGDIELCEQAREKVYSALRFFDKYKNEYGLLEDLESWVFIEWSICNDEEYTKGVNYPSNMLYAFMLDKIADLYGDEKLRKEAENIRGCIVKFAFNGKFFVDNATRENGALKNCDTHLSETCQYYALFMGLNTSDEFKRMMLEEFGPLRKDKYPEVGRSNMFIGNYLRFLWLLSIGERERTVNECLEYFDKMASTTGTLWENDKATASCNHGFASVAAHILASSLIGFETVKDGKPIFSEGSKPLSGYDAKFTFNYHL